MEDFVSWKDTSKIKKQVQEYNDMVGNKIFKFYAMSAVFFFFFF